MNGAGPENLYTISGQNPGLQKHQYSRKLTKSCISYPRYRKYKESGSRAKELKREYKESLILRLRPRVQPRGQNCTILSRSAYRKYKERICKIRGIRGSVRARRALLACRVRARCALRARGPVNLSMTRVNESQFEAYFEAEYRAISEVLSQDIGKG